MWLAWGGDDVWLQAQKFRLSSWNRLQVCIPLKNARPSSVAHIYKPLVFT